jgi:hypothetical protein
MEHCEHPRRLASPRSSSLVGRVVRDFALDANKRWWNRSAWRPTWLPWLAHSSWNFLLACAMHCAEVTLFSKHAR